MLIETTELTLSHVALGALDEVALLSLFASAHCHRLTEGTGHSIRDISDAAGAPLYPGFYWTHVEVPIDRPIERHQVWDRVDVGVEVRSFGRMILDTSYVLAAGGELSSGVDHGLLPRMRGGIMFVVADRGGGDPQPSAPRQGSVAELDQLERAPEALQRFRRVQAAGIAAIEPSRGPLRASLPHPVFEQRDASRGQHVMFARFTSMMDQAETALLSRRIAPAFSSELLQTRSLLERETFYLENCGVGDLVSVDVSVRLEPPAAARLDNDSVWAAGLVTAFELYNARTGRLLVVSRAHKVLRVPRARASLLRETERLLARHGAPGEERS